MHCNSPNQGQPLPKVLGFSPTALLLAFYSHLVMYMTGVCSSVLLETAAVLDGSTLVAPLYRRSPLTSKLPRHTTTPHRCCHCLPDSLFNNRLPRHQAKTHAIAEHREAPAG